MKLVLLALALFALQQADCGEPMEQQRGYYVIRVCAEKPIEAAEIGMLVNYENRWLAPTDVRFMMASDSCDVTVEFGGIRIRDAAAVSFVWSGIIKLRQGEPHNHTNLMHEVLHCAGMPHENDPTSIMWKYAGGPAELRGHHVEALRRLAGVTPLGRVVRQAESMR